ncbi:protoporphyrinogen/coproporphyrinogen oxidase [Polyangium mundeleinium]|uniref:FAD-dependent oxidoreductase n=1 Tax=Polyangium mundeleinium TaxID=2995306 RepID=A0ABT5F5Y4_9BACT|nr:FAD-dependent oxidoreductase [Polyangium mundeleinium]MDC0749513.1 FAD-dependent oxidoreductase [Polyangium mundeleinium]
MIRSPRTPVAILGAGLTGMSASFHLGRAGAPHRLFERLGRPGGHAITLEDEGYRFDRTGHLLHLRDPDLRALALDWIGDDWIEVERRSRIWSHGTYTRYPFQANTFGLPPEIAYECLHGFVRAHHNPDKPAPKNFEEFCLQHFGEGISKHFMIPYNTRLWGVSPREITAAWCSRFVPLPKLEDVLAGAVGLNDRELGYNTRFVYPRLGIGKLAEGMAKSLPTRIELGRAPASIDFQARELHFEDETVPYDVLVSTAPLPVLVERLAGAPANVVEAARRLRCTHLYYLDVALDGPCGEPLHWVYVPEEKYPFYRVGCYSNFSDAMAPPGKASLYVELADRSEPDLPALLPRVAEGLTEMRLIDSPKQIRFARVRRIDHAYVIFDHAYFESLEVVLPFLEENGIVTAGRYGGWNYSSMEDALRFGRDAATKVISSLGGGAAKEP